MYSVQLKLSVHSPHCLYCQLVHLTWMFFSLDTRKWFPATVFRFKSRPLNILSLHIEEDGNSSKCIRANLAQGNTSQSLPTRYQVGMSAYTIHGQTFLTMLSVCSQISMYQSKAPMLRKATPNTVTQSNTYIHGHQPHWRKQHFLWIKSKQAVLCDKVWSYGEGRGGGGGIVPHPLKCTHMASNSYFLTTQHDTRSKNYTYTICMLNV